MASLKVKIGADATQFERTMRGVKSSIGGVKSSILGVAGAAGALMAVNKAFDLIKSAAREAFDFIKSSSEVAASVESIGVQFETLLGSAEAAERRMRELFDFAKTTPFEIKELAQTSSMLQGMTEGALAMGDGLRMVGDAAAAVNQPLDVIASNIGLLYSGLTQGGEVGEAANQLMKYGLVTGQTRRQLKEFVQEANAGKRAFLDQGQAMEALQGIFGKTEGAMARLAETTNGKMTMVHDAIFEVKKAFGDGFNDGLKVALDAATDFIPKFKEKMSEVGKTIGLALTEAVEGDSERLKMIGFYLGSFIAEGIEKATSEVLKLVVRNAEAVATLGGTEALRFAGYNAGFAGKFQSTEEIGQKYSLARSGMLSSMAPPPEVRIIGNTAYTVQPSDAKNPSPFFDPTTGERLIILAEDINRKLDSFPSP